jgi:hypothetical protein
VVKSLGAGEALGPKVGMGSMTWRGTSPDSRSATMLFGKTSFRTEVESAPSVLKLGSLPKILVLDDEARKEFVVESCLLLRLRPPILGSSQRSSAPTCAYQQMNNNRQIPFSLFISGQIC